MTKPKERFLGSLELGFRGKDGPNGPTFREFVSEDGFILVRVWADGVVTIAKRFGRGFSWSDPIRCNPKESD
jgi:hypothetical protein